MCSAGDGRLFYDVWSFSMIAQDYARCHELPTTLSTPPPRHAGEPFALQRTAPTRLSTRLSA